MFKRLQKLSTFATNNVILTASFALLLSGALQFGAAWLQYATRESSCRAETAGVMGRGFAKREYTWIGDDFPANLGIAPEPYGLDVGDPVLMILEDSNHYPAEGPDADAEWESVYPGQSGGFIRVGPNRRFFGLTVYHQIHCLDSIRFAMLGRDHPVRRGLDGEKRMVPHAQHCLNFLRQTILCSADLTLEPEASFQDVEEGLFTRHVCKDWSRVHAFVEQNDVEYRQWKANQTLHGPEGTDDHTHDH